MTDMDTGTRALAIGIGHRATVPYHSRCPRRAGHFAVLCILISSIHPGKFCLVLKLPVFFLITFIDICAFKSLRSKYI